MSNYAKFKRQALRDDPSCARCGMENGVGHERLHWHHLIPQHTGGTDHSRGILLCRRCHHMIHRQHKVVGADGYAKQGLPLPKRKNVRRRQAEAERLLNSYTS